MRHVAGLGKYKSWTCFRIRSIVGRNDKIHAARSRHEEPSSVVRHCKKQSTIPHVFVHTTMIGYTNEPSKKKKIKQRLGGMGGG